MFTLKVLSGPLYGSDITLSDTNTFFVVGQHAIDADAGGVDQPERAPLAAGDHTLYLPHAEDSPNFLMHLAPYSQHNADGAPTELSSDAYGSAEEHAFTALVVTIYHIDGVVDQPIAFNHPHRIGALWVAVKASHLPWSDAVDAFLRNGVAAFMRVPEGAAREDADNDQSAYALDVPQSGSAVRADGLGPRRRFSASWKACSAVTLIVVIGAACVAWSLAREDSATRPSSTLMQLASNSADAVVLSGRDRQIFMLVGDDRIESWGRLLHSKGLYAHNMSVRGLDQELQRVNDVLDRAHVRYWQVRMNDPTHPNVLVHEGLTPIEKTRIHDLLMTHLPYAKQVAIEEVNSDDVIAEAESRLKVAGIEYQIERFSDRASIVIAGALDDRQLRLIDQAARHFKTLWGDRFIHFSVQLAERRAGGIIKQQGPILIRYQHDHVGFSS